MVILWSDTASVKATKVAIVTINFMVDTQLVHHSNCYIGYSLGYQLTNITFPLKPWSKAVQNSLKAIINVEAES